MSRGEKRVRVEGAPVRRQVLAWSEETVDQGRRLKRPRSGGKCMHLKLVYRSAGVPALTGSRWTSV